MRKFKPATQMFASSGDSAIKSIDSNSSPCMMEKAQSSEYMPVMSGFFITSVFFPGRTSRILLTGTVLEKENALFFSNEQTWTYSWPWMFSSWMAPSGWCSDSLRACRIVCTGACWPSLWPTWSHLSCTADNRWLQSIGGGGAEKKKTNK